MLHWHSTAPLALEGTQRDTPGHVCGTRLSSHKATDLWLLTQLV